MTRPRGAVFVPVDDYHGMNFYPHEKTRPGAPAAKHGTETGNPTTDNEQKGIHMSTTQNTKTPEGFTPQYDWIPQTGEPDYSAVVYFQGPELVEPGVSLNAVINSPGADVIIRDDHYDHADMSLDDLPRLAAAILRFHDEVRRATQESTEYPLTRTNSGTSK